VTRRSISGAAWLFTPSTSACSACAAMAGVYDEVPVLPAHDGCRWQVQRLEPSSLGAPARAARAARGRRSAGGRAALKH